ncbi:MAG TPA: ChaN family lipoprotein [Nitrospirota bacterium]|nr:ChaN family lipoprotein [Nitrospirota bacterium]
MRQQGPKLRDKPAYRLYDGGGTEMAYQDVLDRCAKSDILLFGELHEHPLVHWLQLELTRDLYEIKKDDLMLGAEMLEADNQLIVDEYLAGLVEHEHLVKEAKVWENYDTDYRPLVDVAKEHGLRFIATNIPRRYASLVARNGMKALEHLADEAKRYIAPLPIVVDLSTPGYGQAMEIGMAHGSHMDAQNFVAAQAVKDATMAYFILKNRRPKDLFIHYNGDYHSKDCGGICWYLKRQDPDITVRTISSFSKDTPVFDDDCKDAADIVLVVPTALERRSS